jgi:hypothetical protein
MSLLRKFKVIKITAFVMAGLAANPLLAQKVCKNQYPCGSCAMQDNNGNDLAGFTRNYKKQLLNSGSKVVEHADDQWGYLLVRTVQVPSVSSKWETKGVLDYSAYIRTTLAMNKTKAGATATWWARECNLDNGPLVQVKAKDEGKVEMEQQRYEKVMSGLGSKKLTLVEYLDTFNMRDYDYLLKSHIVAKCGAIDQDDYKNIVDFFNGFIGKFSYVDDPVLTKNSFITFVKGNSGTRFIAYFNVVNGKLSGKLDALDIQYDRDRDSVVKRTFNRLTGKTIYIYGDDSFGLDKTIIQYAKANDLKLRRRKTSATMKFNDER